MTNINESSISFMMYLNRYSDRFLTGTDFVASYGAPQDYPGEVSPPRGCRKDIVSDEAILTGDS